MSATVKLSANVLASAAADVRSALLKLYKAGAFLGMSNPFGALLQGMENYADILEGHAKAKGLTLEAKTAPPPAAAPAPVPPPVPAPAAARTVKPAPRKAKKSAPARKAKSARPCCKGTSANGSPCKSRIVLANGYCRAHQQQAAPAPSKPTAAPAPVAYPAGTVLVADGKGGVRPASEADLWAALDALTGRKAA